MIENGADSNMTDKDGNTPLMLIIGVNLFFTGILFFINQIPNSSLNLQNNEGDSPLALAVCNPVEEMMEATKL